LLRKLGGKNVAFPNISQGHSVCCDKIRKHNFWSQINLAMHNAKEEVRETVIIEADDIRILAISSFSLISEIYVR
jgi:hypothetical protein